MPGSSLLSATLLPKPAARCSTSPSSYLTLGQELESELVSTSISPPSLCGFGLLIATVGSSDKTPRQPKTTRTDFHSCSDLCEHEQDLEIILHLDRHCYALDRNFYAISENSKACLQHTRCETVVTPKARNSPWPILNCAGCKNLTLVLRKTWNDRGSKWLKLR